MRLLLLFSTAFFIIAFVCQVVPTSVVGIHGPAWLVLGLLVWVVDELLGGPVYGPGIGRRP